MNRRDFLWSGAALASMMGLPGLSLAAGASDRKLLMVFCNGGWDPTRTLAPMFGTDVAMEATATAATVGGLPIVDHPDRPSVRAFFEAWGSRSTIVNGMVVPSIAHEACTRIMMTGSPDDGRSDWGAIVGASASELLLPHLVMGGPSFGGPLGTSVVRTGTSGQLAELVDGSAMRAADGRLTGLSPASSDAVDRALAARAQARVSAARTDLETERTAAFAEAVDRLGPLRGIESTVDLSVGFGLRGQIPVAIDALSAGLSRSAMMEHELFYDSHTNNDFTQSSNQESLFADLLSLMAQLQGAPGAAGGTLLDETTIVVMSEMGRTPQLNGDDGKDHWPFTSALVVGAGLQGGRVLGAFDDRYEGRGVDPATGDVVDGAQDLSAGVLGATLLASMDIDPAEYLPGVDPITGVLA